MTKLQHLGIIADGNRRWAKEKNLPKIEGHKEGLNAIERLIDGASEAGIPYLSFYVFSTENWGRSKEEVSYIMKLLETRIMKYAKKMKAKNGKMVILGSKAKVPPKLMSTIEQAEKMTEDCTGITVGFCFNYGGGDYARDDSEAFVSSGGAGCGYGGADFGGRADFGIYAVAGVLCGIYVYQEIFPGDARRRH